MSIPKIRLKVHGDASTGLTIRVCRGRALEHRSVVITRDLLLSFGGENNEADAFDLVRAVVGEIDLALKEMQSHLPGPKAVHALSGEAAE